MYPRPCEEWSLNSRLRASCHFPSLWQFMVKKKVTSRSTVSAAASAARKTTPASVAFPGLSPKQELDCRAILEDQILIIDVRQIAPGYLRFDWGNNRISSRLLNAKPMSNSLIAFLWNWPLQRRKGRPSEWIVCSTILITLISTTHLDRQILSLFIGFRSEITSTVSATSTSIPLSNIVKED